VLSCLRLTPLTPSGTWLLSTVRCRGCGLLTPSLICFYQPISRVGYFGGPLHAGTHHGGTRGVDRHRPRVLGWWGLGRYCQHYYGQTGVRPSRFWLAWMIYFALVPVSKRLPIDVSSLWLAALSVREARLSLGFRPHCLPVAGGLCVRAFVPLLAPLRDPGIWTMSALLLETCGLVIAIGDHRALRRTTQAVTAFVREPAFVSRS
jgi:hypothetical protein